MSAYPNVIVEAWILSRLDCPTLFDGLTTSAQRRERLRKHLLDKQLGLAIAGGRDGKAESWENMFQRIHNEPL